MLKKKEETATAKEPRKAKAPRKVNAPQADKVKRERVYVQYAGKEWEAEALIAQVRAAYVADGHRPSSIRTLEVYIKPEDGKVYYVVNQKASGSIDL